MIEAFKVYRYYLAIKLHFTSDKYDVIESKGVIKCSREAFSRRKDHYLFEKLGRRFDKDLELIQYLISNFAYGNGVVIYNEDDATENWKTWDKRKQSITNVFKNDLDFIHLQIEKHKLNPQQVFNSNDSNPYLLKWFLSGDVTVETMCLLDDNRSYLNSWKDKLGLLFGKELRIISKCKPFVKVDRSKIQSIYNQFIQDTSCV